MRSIIILLALLAIPLASLAVAPVHAEENEDLMHNYLLAIMGTVPMRGDVAGQDLTQFAAVNMEKASVGAPLAVKGGQIVDIQLMVINGYLVYFAHVQNTYGTYEVVIDAGGRGALLGMNLVEGEPIPYEN